jgi:hypothetical protein
MMTFKFPSRLESGVIKPTTALNDEDLKLLETVPTDMHEIVKQTINKQNIITKKCIDTFIEDKNNENTKIKHEIISDIKILYERITKKISMAISIDYSDGKYMSVWIGKRNKDEEFHEWKYKHPGKSIIIDYFIDNLIINGWKPTINKTVDIDIETGKHDDGFVLQCDFK